jgi:hypothetical protein
MKVIVAGVRFAVGSIGPVLDHAAAAVCCCQGLSVGLRAEAWLLLHMDRTKIWW